MPKSRQALVERLYDGLVLVGFDYRARQAEKATEPRLWLRPPLFTDLELAGEPLQDYLSIGTRLEPDELADTYERFIAGFFYTKKLRSQHSDEWLRRAAKVGYYDGQSLFIRPNPGELRRGLHMNLVQFAALVAYNCRVHVDHGSKTLVAITVKEGFQFGVRDGRLVSNISRPRRAGAIRGLESKPRLADHWRDGRSTKDATLLDTIDEWLEEREARLGAHGKALRLALQILWWRAPRGSVPTKLRQLTVWDYSIEAMSAACAQAREYSSFDKPVQMLKEIFYPRYLTQREFTELFGDPHRRVTQPLPEGIRLKWDQAINSLDPGYQGD